VVTDRALLAPAFRVVHGDASARSADLARTRKK
jgi:hypothetical protein